MKTKIKIPRTYNKDERDAIAFDIIEKIIERTSKGKDKDGEPFPKYSSAYKKSLNFKIAGKTDKVNLELSGDMLADMKLLSNKPGEIVIGYSDGTESNAKAEGNILGTYGSKISNKKKARDFLGIDESGLKSVLKKYPKNNKEKRLERVEEVFDIIGEAEEIAGRVIIDELDED